MSKYFFLLLFIPGIAIAQPSLNKGQFQLNTGLGFSSSGIPVYLGLDYAFHRDMTIGAEGTLRFFNKNSFVSAVGNWNYHFNTLAKIEDKYDFYAGVNVGFYTGLNNTVPIGFTGGLQIGGRYYFGRVFGLNFELGGNNVFGGGKFGISLRL